jgi:hypothetical protein
MNAESEMAGGDGLGGEPKRLDPCAQIAESVGYSAEAYESGLEQLIAYKDALEDAVRQLTADDDDELAALEGNALRAALGKRAVDAGTPDREGDGSNRTDAIDTVANVLHYLASVGEDEPAGMLSSAAAHFYVETEGGK